MEIKAYNISAYDHVYIVLKSNVEHYKNLVKYSSSKKRNFLEGRIVELSIIDRKSEKKHHFPKSGTIAFVNSTVITEFKNAVDKEKLNFITNIFYADIDYITLSFDSFDWKNNIVKDF